MSMPGGLPGTAGRSHSPQAGYGALPRDLSPQMHREHGEEKNQLRAFRVSVVNSSVSLGRHLAKVEVVLRRHPEGIGHAIEEGEHGNDVHRLGNLVLRPAMVA